MQTTESFIRFLQSCITPVALISGVGLLLLTITNRLGRTIDRTRQLINELDNANVKRRSEKKREVKILYKRSKYLRLSIGLIVISVICSSLIIPVLFFMNLCNIDLRVAGYLLFVMSVLSLLLSSVYFFGDVWIALNALKLEAKEHLEE